MTIIAEIIAWLATFFRGAGMLAKKANTVKYLVSVGNLFWMINGIMTKNVPLVVSNGFCLAVMLFQIVKAGIGNKKNHVEKINLEVELDTRKAQKKILELSKQLRHVEAELSRVTNPKVK